MTGGSLSDAMRLARKFTLRRAMEVAVDCARGLAYLHAKKNGAIIHRWDLLLACSLLTSEGVQEGGTWGNLVPRMQMYQLQTGVMCEGLFC